MLILLAHRGRSLRTNSGQHEKSSGSGFPSSTIKPWQVNKSLSYHFVFVDERLLLLVQKDQQQQQRRHNVLAVKQMITIIAVHGMITYDFLTGGTHTVPFSLWYSVLAISRQFPVIDVFRFSNR